MNTLHHAEPVNDPWPELLASGWNIRYRGSFDEAGQPEECEVAEVAALVVGFGGVLTRLTDAQAAYIGVSVDGPFKPESYKY